MKYFILILLTFVFISCDSDSGTEIGKSGLQTAYGLCSEEFSKLETIFNKCKEDVNFQSSMIDYSCKIFDDTRLKTKEDVDLMGQCIFKIRDLSCTELSNITKPSDIENCYLYDKPENYKTKKELCVDDYYYFCKNSYNVCDDESSTEVCEEAKYQNTSPDEDPKAIHFSKEILGNYCNSSDADEKVTIYDLKCPENIKTCEDFQSINFEIDEYYTACFTDF